jgi:hypothetical protein
MGTEAVCHVGRALTRGVAVVIGLCGVAVAALYGMILVDIAHHAETWWAVGLWTMVLTEVAVAVGILAGAVRSSENRALALWNFFGVSWVMAVLNVSVLAYMHVW